jgi:N-acetylmuramoyl-L-alanine amidase
MEIFSGWDDIGYHWLVGEDGRVYEGRGWDARGAHARQHNAWTYGICVMGDFRNVTPNDAALNALRDIIDCGVQQVHNLSKHTVYVLRMTVMIE